MLFAKTLLALNSSLRSLSVRSVQRILFADLFDTDAGKTNHRSESFSIEDLIESLIKNDCLIAPDISRYNLLLPQRIAAALVDYKVAMSSTVSVNASANQTDWSEPRIPTNSNWLMTSGMALQLGLNSSHLLINSYLEAFKYFKNTEHFASGSGGNNNNNNNTSDKMDVAHFMSQ